MSTNTRSDRNVKVLLIGDSGVGKSSLLLSFTTGSFDEDIAATIGIDFKIKKVEVVDADTGRKLWINLQLWDTAGQERFRTLTSSYYRGAQAVALVYDVNEPQTFRGLIRWMEEADSYCRKGKGDDSVVYLLIGNKVDCCASEEAMAVSVAEARALAREHRMLFALTSAKTTAGVAQAFDELARDVYDKWREDDHDERRRGTNLSNPGAGGGNQSGGCC